MATKKIPERRALDPKITAFMTASTLERTEIRRAITDVQAELKANTAITKDVADLIASFRVLAAVGKWIAAVGAGLAAVWHGWDFLRIK